jgi:hypothetical protein
MVDSAAEVDPSRVETLLETGDLEAARAALSRAPEPDDRFAVLRIKLRLLDGSLPPAVAMTQLIQLMRRNENHPGAKELYQKASSLAYQARESSVAHSHPPPPDRTPRG